MPAVCLYVLSGSGLFLFFLLFFSHVCFDLLAGLNEWYAICFPPFCPFVVVCTAFCTRQAVFWKTFITLTLLSYVDLFWLHLCVLNNSVSTMPRSRVLVANRYDVRRIAEETGRQADQLSLCLSGCQSQNATCSRLRDWLHTPR